MNAFDLLSSQFLASPEGARFRTARSRQLDADVAEMRAIGKRVRMPSGQILEPIYRAPDDSFLYLPIVQLPGIYVQKFTPMLVSVPAAYGTSEPFRDVFVAADLRRKTGGSISRHLAGRLMHLLPGGQDGTYRDRLRGLLGFPAPIPELAYLCIHAKQRKGLWEYVKQLTTHLSNPVR